jgi:hypothetical protein
MFSFIASTLGLMIDPVILVGGFLAAWFFHLEMNKLGWGLLLGLLPAVPTLWPVHQGMFLGGLAQLLAGSAVAAAIYWFLETLKTRPRRAADS